MDKDFFEGLIKWKIERGDMSPFGWYADISEFIIDGINQNKEGFLIRCSSENLYEGKIINDKRFKKDIYLLHDEINEYISHIRDSKINSLGI